jgi:hypothetical protein
MRDIIRLVENPHETILHDIARHASALDQKCAEAIASIHAPDQDTITMLLKLASACHFARHWLPGGKKDH